MLILRLFQFIALWSFTAVVWAHAWMASVAVTAIDGRIRLGLVTCLGAWLAGTFFGALLARVRPSRWPALDLHRHVLALLVTALCVTALSHVAPHVSIKVLREEVPPFMGWIYPALCALTPLLLRRTAATHALRDQLLLCALFTTALSGAMFFLAPPVALGLALITLGWQLDAAHRLPERSRLAWIAIGTVLLICVASHIGYSRVAARGAESWLLACAALGAAIAVRPRALRDWRQVLGASVLAAVLVAVCGALVTVWLGRVIAWEPALNSRLVLFRVHPNFLATFYGFHALLALVLGLTRARAALPWIAACALLVASAWMTDSRTGFAALAASFVVLAVLPLLASLLRRVRLPLLAAGVLVGGLALGGAWLAAGGTSAMEKLTARVDRFEKSLDFRLDAWKNSVTIVKQHPLAGIGPQTFLAVERFEPGSRFFNSPLAPHPHNVFLYVAQAAGLPALLLFVAWIALLLARLLRRAGPPPAADATPPAERIPRLLPLGLAAAIIGLLLANLLDLGLALESVVPAPLLIATGLALSALRSGGPARPRWQPLLAGALLFALFIPLVLTPLRALAAVEQAQLQAYDAGLRLGHPDGQAAARASIEHALELDPAVPRAHALLSRWQEDLPGGFSAARDTLLRLIDLAPNDGAGHRLLARLYMRNAMWAEAEAHFLLALADARGSDSTAQDRADRILCLARQGRREEALNALTDALRLDSGVMHRIPWNTVTADNRHLAIGGSEKQPPIDLADAQERVFMRHRTDHEAGLPVGYTFWMDCYRTFRTLKRDDRARDVLEYMERNVPEIQAFTFAAERGNLAFDAGELDVALAEFRRAHELSGLAFFQNRAAQVQQAMGADVAAESEQAAALGSLIEILDQPYAFQNSLEAQVRAELDTGRFAEAARTLERTLLFHDDPLERAKLWERIGTLAFRGGDTALGERGLRMALLLLATRPWPLRLLQDGVTDSMPARIARALCDSWRGRGMDARQRFVNAWGLPGFFSSRMGPSLLRLGFYFENAQVDQLLREAELQLLTDETNLLAHWGRLFALEASGRHHELGMAMRALVSQYALQDSAERQWNALAGQMTTRLQDPHAWFQLALLTLLKGQYNGAIDMFANARLNVQDDDAAAADLCGWQALAAFLASRPELGRAALIEGKRLDPRDELLALRLSVIPAVLPGETPPASDAQAPAPDGGAPR